MTTPAPSDSHHADTDASTSDTMEQDDALADDDDRLDEVAGGYVHHHREGTTAADGLLGWLGG